MARIDIKKVKSMVFFLNHQYIFRFQDFFYTKLGLRRILYVIKYITKRFDISFCFMQYVCKDFHKLVFPLNSVYTLSNLHINVLLLEQHVEKRIVITRVINGQIFIIISNIS